jgi:hypothetical protein
LVVPVGGAGGGGGAIISVKSTGSFNCASTTAMPKMMTAEKAIIQTADVARK